MAPEPGSLPTRRIMLVADELPGYVQTGGLGTATTFLALALARLGHDVEVLYLGPQGTPASESEWTRLHESAPVRIRTLPRGETSIEPQYFARMREVELALR